MVSKEVSSHVVSLGCSNKFPKGGIAQVLYNYEHYVFEDFNFVTISRRSNIWNNIALFTRGLLKFIFILIFKRKIKIVHIHTSQRKSFIRSNVFMRLAKVFKKKLVLHIHGGGFKDYYFEEPEYVTKCLKRCDVIIVLSDEWKQFLESIGFESLIVENVINKPIILESHAHDDAVHMLFLGLITKLKGIYDLVEVIAEHKDELSGRLLLHIGGNGETDVLLKQINDLGVEDIIKFEGWVSSDKKTELMNMCRVYVLPSYVEGLPLSILEAMSYNMAIIATRIGGIPSIVKEDENGILINPGNKDEIYAAIKALVFDKDKLKDLSANNSCEVNDFYPEIVATKLENIYLRLINK